MSPKVPRDLPPRKLKKALRKKKWYYVDQAKEGELFKNDNFPYPIVIPRHKTLKTGTLRHIISYMGITVEEFLSLI